MSERVAVCPRCDEPTIRRRDLLSAHSKLDGPASKRYYCDTCKTPFETPAYREPRCRGDTLAATLQQTDPDEILGGSR